MSISPHFHSLRSVTAVPGTWTPKVSFLPPLRSRYLHRTTAQQWSSLIRSTLFQSPLVVQGLEHAIVDLDSAVGMVGASFSRNRSCVSQVSYCRFFYLRSTLPVEMTDFGFGELKQGKSAVLPPWVCQQPSAVGQGQPESFSITRLSDNPWPMTSASSQLVAQPGKPQHDGPKWRTRTSRVPSMFYTRATDKRSLICFLRCIGFITSPLTKNPSLHHHILQGLRPPRGQIQATTKTCRT
ncbi:hypothetical protein JMJ77_0004230 [Colletotrichum scovillei]|uniref:Uncharacterized protein n=1 Tax=Colletotrichum scovillei TaxID=1209932 RepID=A0A9P7UB68_9PEZI|nr:hypothetical protein JMJ77_0004230 [Colletotrichum scovillei]KAG7049483.1 hypothetical protein JMJ78_0013465 [Colletotrichum scovillei]KAG7064222.1 hypothetical protein JMJ76_0007269 [Colletotrichum scovillei]